jgi:pimeloyl-ACP methyl ester carboxylesterase
MRVRRKALVTVVVAASLILAACEVPNPARGSAPDPGWGVTTLRPARADVPYVGGAARGCPGVLTSDERCGGSQTLDIYPATGGGSRGTLVYLHGGGFVGGDKYPMADLGGLLRLTQRGWTVVSANYRLVSGTANRFPTASRDAAAALSWIWIHGTGLGLNVERLVVVGHSAGGTLAALMGTARNSGRGEFAGIPAISGWASIAGVNDFAAGPLSRFWAIQFVGNDRIASLGNVASPITWWDPTDPLGYMVHGDRDQFVEVGTMNRWQSRVGNSGRVEFDRVDRWSDGGVMPVSHRSHQPTRGMNWPHFENWMNKLPGLSGPGAPFGSVDVLRLSADQKTARVTGWAIDPNTPRPIDVEVLVNNRVVGRVPANLARPDVGNVHRAYGPNHGFDTTVAVPGGRNQVCVRAANVGPGPATQQLRCATFTTSAGLPFGSFDAARPAGPGAARIEGWTIDPDTPNPIAIHVYVDGVMRGQFTAGVNRPDVGSAFPAFGPNHGFNATVTNLPRGNRQVCVFAINVGPGGRNPQIGCRTVAVT